MPDCCHPGLLAQAPALDAAQLLLTGATVSLGHCLGMCGPLLGAWSAAQQGERPRRLGLLAPLIVYHAGRVAAYGAIGLVLGAVGAAVNLTAARPAVQGGLSLLVGGLMMLLALGLGGWSAAAARLESGRLAGAVARRLRGLLGARGWGARLAMGAANGLLPCGPVYAIALGSAAAAHPGRGAAAMLLYGAGTVPVLVAFGLGAGRLGPAFRARARSAGAVLVALIGLQLLLRGAATLGWVGHFRVGEVVFW